MPYTVQSSQPIVLPTPAVRHSAPVNHRRRGQRESIKLASRVTSITSDADTVRITLTADAVALDASALSFQASFRTLLSALEQQRLQWMWRLANS